MILGSGLTEHLVRYSTLDYTWIHYFNLYLFCINYFNYQLCLIFLLWLKRKPIVWAFEISFVYLPSYR